MKSAEERAKEYGKANRGLCCCGGSGCAGSGLEEPWLAGYAEAVRRVKHEAWDKIEYKLSPGAYLDDLVLFLEGIKETPSL